MMLPQSLHAHFISEVSSITPFDQKLTGGRRKAATIATTGGLAHWTAIRNALRCTRLSESPACVTAEELRQKRVRSSAKDRPSMGGGSVLPHQAAAAFASAATNESRGASSRLVDGDGVVIVDHGSRRAQSNAMLHEFVNMYKEETGHQLVEAAHMELATPTIADAFDRCVEQGATRIIICPYFLFPGRHWDKDIPALAAAAALRYPRVPYLVTAPIGLHKLMVMVIQDRMEYCLRQAGGEVSECDMCKGTGRCKQLTSCESHSPSDTLRSSIETLTPS